MAVGEVEALCALAHRLLSGSDPGAALIQWLRTYIDHVSTHSGLAAALNAEPGEDSTLIAAAHRAVESAGTTLLDEAVKAGAVRPDLQMADLLALVNAIATAAESGGRPRAGRLLRLVLEGIAIQPRCGRPACCT